MTGGEEQAWHIDAPRVPTEWSKVPIPVSIFRDSFRGCAVAVFYSSRFYGEKKIIKEIVHTCLYPCCPYVRRRVEFVP